MKFILISIALFFSTSGYSQIGKSKKAEKIIEIGNVDRVLGDYISVYTLSYLEKDGIKFYGLAFTNEQTLYDGDSPDQKILTFSATQNELDYLFNFLLDGFKADQIKYLEVGQDMIKTLPLTNKFLYIYVDFKDGTSASLKLKKRQLYKLFGKKKPKGKWKIK